MPNHYAEYMTNLAIETGACCATFAAGGDCCHSVDPNEGMPTPEEMIADGWYLEDGAWTSDETKVREAEEAAAREAEAEERRKYLAGLPTDYVPF